MDAETLTLGKGKNPKLLTLIRAHDGKLLPYIDGDLILGCVDASVHTDNSEQVVQLVFHSSYVMFETQLNPYLKKMN